MTRNNVTPPQRAREMRGLSGLAGEREESGELGEG